jgi:hypothetical protein
MVNNSTKINKTKESLYGDGQQFHKYQQNKRKFKQRWSTIPQISRKRTITSEYQKGVVCKDNMLLDVFVYIVRWLSIFAMSFYTLYSHVIKDTTEIWYKQSKHILKYNIFRIFINFRLINEIRLSNI